MLNNRNKRYSDNFKFFPHRKNFFLLLRAPPGCGFIDSAVTLKLGRLDRLKPTCCLPELLTHKRTSICGIEREKKKK